MEYWQYAAGLAAAVCAVLAVRSAVRKRRARKQRDFTRKLEMVLQSRETVKTVCPSSHGGRWILTSRRLLLDTREGFLAIPLDKIKKIRSFDAGGKPTAALGKTRQIQVLAQGEYTLRGSSETFTQFVRQLKQMRRKQKADQKST